MTDETIVAIYDTHAHAELAAADLAQAGVPQSAISVHASTAPMRGDHWRRRGEEGFWASLFGGAPDHDTAVYDRSVDSGSTVVTVKAPEAHIAKVMEILESHKPIDIDERATSYGMAQGHRSRSRAAPVALAADAAARTGARADGGVIQLSEESLAVGKRVVNRGGTRIRRFVVETPVEESVTLHSEKVVAGAPPGHRWPPGQRQLHRQDHRDDGDGRGSRRVARPPASTRRSACARTRPTGSRPCATPCARRRSRSSRSGTATTTTAAPAHARRPRAQGLSRPGPARPRRAPPSESSHVHHTDNDPAGRVPG